MNSRTETVEKQVRHTPGPWGVEQTATTNWIGPMRTSGDGKVREIVCDTDRDSDLKPECRERNDANARLIAAAPELLEFARAYLDSESTTDKLDKMAKALIARVEGGAS